MKKLFLLAATVAMTFTMTNRAQAAVAFDPTGGGCAVVCYQIDVLDPTVGNSISIGIPGATAPIGTVGDLYFQANLGVANLSGVQQYSNGDNGSFFTFAAAFKEMLTARAALGPNTAISFGAPAPTGEQGVFNMYRQPTTGNDQAGVCFVNCAAGSVLVLSGTLINDANFFGSFVTNFASGFQALDQSPDGNDYPGVQTISGSGSFGATIRITFAADGYFPNLVDGSSLVFATTEQRLPYITADPSACFSNNGVTSCNQVGVASVGATNGLGNNTMLQTDASLKLVNATEIPEPATMTMLGLGLLGAAAARKFRSRKA
jgi:hypothetical protein